MIYTTNLLRIDKDNEASVVVCDSTNINDELGYALMLPGTVKIVCSTPIRESVYIKTFERENGVGEWLTETVLGSNHLV